MNISLLGNSLEKLAEVFKEACGIYLEPKKKIAINKAELQIQLENAKAQLEVDKINLINRAKLRLYETEIQRQLNLETIIQHSFNTIDVNAKPELIDKDWLNFFISMAQDAGDDFLKSVWSNVLNQESVQKGSFSKYTLNVLKVMTTEDCKLFSDFCNRTVNTEHHTILIKINSNKSFQESYDFDFAGFIRLGDLGLVNQSELSNIRIHPKEELLVTFPDNKLFSIRNDGDSDFLLELYFLTIAGKELKRIQQPLLNNIYFNSLNVFFKDRNISVNSQFFIETGIKRIKETSPGVTELEELSNIPAFVRKYSLSLDDGPQIRLRDNNSYLYDNVD
jgi:hypothetical protein